MEYNINTRLIANQTIKDRNIFKGDVYEIVEIKGNLIFVKNSQMKNILSFFKSTISNKGK